MREIKFRAWDKKYKKMHPYFLVYSLGNHDLCRLSDEFNDYIWLQSTGLNDKSGRKIFEGDIVEFHSKSYGVFNAPIIWNEEKAMFAVTTCYPYKAKQITMPEREWERKHDPCDCDGAMYETVFTPLGNNLDKIKVIGNVYENPELLEE